MKTRLPVGVIGVGRMGSVYTAHVARRVPNARLVAVADIKPGLAESFAAEYDLPKWYNSHQELLDDKEIKAVFVITPTSTHQEVVLDAVRSGKAIFCEKPMSTSIAG